MNVSVENLAPCRKLMRVEVEAAVVDAEFDKATVDIRRRVQLPGFRPGKAPLPLVLRNFSKRIEDDVKHKLIPDAFKKALEQQKLRAVGYPDIEEIQFGRGQALQFAATIETQPEFELPEYKGLTLQREKRAVTEEDLERALNLLRDQRANFADVNRPVGDGDYVVVNYTGTCEGKPLTDYAPSARGLTQQNGFWIHVGRDTFIPGFSEQILGAQPGEHRTVKVDFPGDFVTKELAGRKGVYEVEVVQVKERVLPELSDEFAKAFGAESLARLREGVREDLQKELNHKLSSDLRNQIVRELLKRVTFDLPESFVERETRNVVFDVVRENQQRGVTKDQIEKQKENIYAFANNNAKERVKAGFLISRIAEKESIKADQKEVTQRIVGLAQQYQIKPEKLVRQLQERDGIAEIHQQIITAKVLDLLQLHAQVQEVSPAPAAPAGA